MKQTKQGIEETECSLISSLIDRLLIPRFYHLQIPRRELIPEQFIDSHHRLAQTIFTERIVYLGDCLIQLHLEPFHGDSGCLRLGDRIVYRPALHQAESVPYLIIEVTSLLTQSIIERNIISGRSREHQAHTYAVRTVLLDQLQRIGRVS